ncbi:hypothetical protein CHS0354_033465 [Potamilus streckersoni]|uniref:Breast cancer anti-estrogen resistance protein 3 n=1 Tax=Potamilus streckersoni TaxID=2493646 RepID=A0AAE0VW81_9BIVA|nr:hypothetical protein CHS0354_033465 [Potamilus streckersoni]
MAQKHIDINTWLDAIGMKDYHHIFASYSGVEDLLYLSEADIRDLGLKNAAHRAKVVSSLRVLREKYECSTLPLRKSIQQAGTTGQVQRTHNATAQLSWSPPSMISSPDYQLVNVSPEKMKKDLLHELQSDPLELKTQPWYHGSISRQRAEQLVKKNGDFLVRDSISKPGDFVLTVCWKGVPLHFVINSKVTDHGIMLPPKVTYHFEVEEFQSVQDLIQFYQHTGKPVTQASLTIIINPIGRSMPLSYYDTKYGALKSIAGVNHYTPTQSPRSSPYNSPCGSPSGSPKSGNSGTVDRAGSQPLLSVCKINQSSSIDRSDSMPTIGGIYKQVNLHPPTEQKPLLSLHQRSGSAPVLTPGIHVTQHFEQFNSSTVLTPASSDSSLDKPPPPKPSRIPSIKYKNRPHVEIHNEELYRDDDRDYTDYSQVKSDPSWLDENERNFTPVNINVHRNTNQTLSSINPGGNIHDNNMNGLCNDTKSTSNRDYEIKQDHLQISKGRKHSDTRFSILDSQDYASVPKFPISDSFPEKRKGRAITEGFDKMADIAVAQSKRKSVKIPQIETYASFELHNFKSVLLPENNRLLDPNVLISLRNQILNCDPKLLAKCMTKADLDVLKVTNEEDLGICVQSGLELLTLPHGKQLRLNVIERCYCMKSFLMVMILTCGSVAERSQMLSHWIQVALELRASHGNLFGFENMMEGLLSPQIQRLHDTWMVLRQNHTNSAYNFDTKLRPAMRALNDGSSLPLQDISIPNIMPLALLLERDGRSVMNYLPWESSDVLSGLDIMLLHLDTARIITTQCTVYKNFAKKVIGNLQTEPEKLEMFQTEFHLRFLWGSRGVGAEQVERHNKFSQLLTVYSEKMEPPGYDGTAV